jgi:hypothetical protein
MTFWWNVVAWVFLLTVPLAIFARRCMALKDEALEAPARIPIEAPRSTGDSLDSPGASLSEAAGYASRLPTIVAKDVLRSSKARA